MLFSGEKFSWCFYGVLLMFLCLELGNCKPDEIEWQTIPVIKMGNHSKAELEILSDQVMSEWKQRQADHSRRNQPLQKLEQISDDVHSNWAAETDAGNESVDGNAVLETILVCDLEFSAVFRFDETEIKKYFSVFFWDAALRLKTLPSSNISLHIAGIVIITDKSDQPFIEKTRDQDGFVAYWIHETLSYFGRWVFERMSDWPHFDVALAVTNAVERDREIGIAHRGQACRVDTYERKHYGTAVFADRGTFRVLVATHEIGHLLGAFHDFDEELPGGCEESSKTFIMNYNATPATQYFFSGCSDRLIGRFVRSPYGKCLKEEGTGSPGLTKLPAPSRLEQCQRYVGRQDVFVDELESRTCSVSKCYLGNDSSFGYEEIRTVDFTPCAETRECFRGRCLSKGFLLQNVDLYTCIQASNRFESTDRVSVVPCLKSDQATPFERFAFRKKDGVVQIFTTYSSVDGEINGNKCVQPDGEKLVLFECTGNDADNENLWNIVTVNETEKIVQLRHKSTGRCVKLVSGNIIASSVCLMDDSNALWRTVA